MSSIWGSNIKISIFGESHGNALGVVLDGLPAGYEIDFEKINLQMKRRRPFENALATSRKEKDSFEVLAGIFNKKTNGSPFCAIIKNEDMDSKDYEKNRFLIRPGHADFTSHIRYSGFEDYRGGGHLSGRLTASMVLAGAVCRQILEKNGIFIASHISFIGDIFDEAFDFLNIDYKLLNRLSSEFFPVINKEAKKEMEEKILKIKEEKDSIGGAVECMIVGVPAGIGDPIFDNIESKISSIVFGIPAVKGIEFGRGFESSKLKGSENNDEFIIKDGKISTKTNNHGGILGGISSGMPIVFRAAFKPTASIGKPQKTVNINDNSEQEIVINGRHDPCIALRAAPVVEAAAALAILDLMNL